MKKKKTRTQASKNLSTIAQIITEIPYQPS